MRALTVVVAAGLLGVAPAMARADEPPAPAPPAAPADFEPPGLLEFVQAPYPADADGREGVVLLEILVRPDGTTGEVKVLQSSGLPAFDEAAVAAAQQFRWTPGRAKGQPVPVRVTYEYRFVMEAPPVPSPEEVAAAVPQGRSVIAGEVLERGTRVPLAGAGVAAVPLGADDAPTGATAAETVTDEGGRFRLEGLPAGRYQVVVVMTDHRTRRFSETVADGETVTVRYRLERDDADPYTTTIEGARDREEVERRTVSVEEATRIPGTRGDALRAIESLPGVSRPPLGAGVLVVRGANPEDTSSYIAGHWVPLVYHFGGITSVVNSDLLSRLDFLPGNFSVRYGRALGAIVDVDVRAPRRDRWQGYVDMDVIDGGFLVEGPVGKGSLAVAARRSWIDAVFSAVVPADSGLDFTQAPVYYDYQILYDTPAAGGRLQLFVFGIDDQLRFAFSDPAELDPALRGDLEQHTLAHRLHVTYRRPLAPATDLMLSAATGYGAVSFGVGPGLRFDAGFFFNSYRAELTHRPFARVRVVAGTEGQFYPFRIDVAGPRPPSEGDLPSPPSTQETLATSEDLVEWTPAIYAEAEIDVGGGLTVTAGSRADYYLLAGETVVDPRLAARWQVDRHRVRFGLGRFSQMPQNWEVNDVYGNPRVDPEQAVHLSLGYDVSLGGPLRLETTLYYKWISDLIVRSDALERRDDGTIRPVGYVNDGRGRVMGAEVLLRHDLSKRFFGWVSYGLSKSERQDGPGEPWRPFQLDQTHVLSVVASWKLPWRMEAGFRFRYVTGNPDTPIVGSIYDADADAYVPIPGEPGSERVGPFHQLDLRVERRWIFDTWSLTGYLDVQNAYNRYNPEGTFYSFDYRDRTTISGLPIIPSIGAKGEF